MRDGLSLLDQAIAFCAGNVTLEKVRAMLGVMDSDVLCDLTEMVLQGRAKEALDLARRIGLDGVSYTQAVRDWASLMHRIAIVQRVPGGVAETDSALQRIQTLASSMTPEEVQLDYQILLQARGDMAQAPDEYAGFTMAILRMLAFKPAGFVPGSKVPEKKIEASQPTAAKPAVKPKAEPVPELPADMPLTDVPPEISAEAAPPWEDLPQESGRGEHKAG